MAQVNAYQKKILEIFEKEYAGKQLPYDKDFYTNDITCTKMSIARDFKEKETIEMWTKWM